MKLLFNCVVLVQRN